VLKQIKSEEKLRMMPVVVLTSSKEEKDMVASYKLGVSAYVVKPVDFHEFVNAIKGGSRSDLTGKISPPNMAVPHGSLSLTSIYGRAPNGCGALR
jgi:DNA-binding response OmpR family regulator